MAVIKSDSRAQVLGETFGGICQHTCKGGIRFIGGAEEVVHALTFSLDTFTLNYT